MPKLRISVQQRKRYFTKSKTNKINIYQRKIKSSLEEGNVNQSLYNYSHAMSGTESKLSEMERNRTKLSKPKRKKTISIDL